MIRSTFAIPILIAVLTLAGLIVALTGDGWRDGAGWIALGAPLLAIGWALRPGRPYRKA
ncbi:hypothetical protein [Sphingomonas sp. LY160]|uniref:hypothetical protein n=1 Tax=Sphingomonas sp. LY160 TaxID=3095342 RepID=UPI002ADEE396|nr:hypothetical protein [Sphingomonas sp. LY160]MEA1072853.1 hypothetical protein [Sphingomonas sp. LY160]